MKFTNRSRIRGGLPATPAGSRKPAVGGSRSLLSAMFALGVVALGLVGCDSGSASAPPPTTVPAATVPLVGGVNDLTPTQGTGASGGGAEVKVELKEWAVELNPKELSAGKVMFDVSNTGTNSHNLVILDSAGAEVGRTPVFKSADGTKTLEVELKPGAYKFICDVPGHAKLGMTTDVTVK
jgi:plastocyanin